MFEGDGVSIGMWKFPKVCGFLRGEDAIDRTRDGEGEKTTELAAEALADVIFQWKNWVYRRVDSVHPSEGARGRLRHSMDCEPPPDPRLAYSESQRGYADIDGVKGQLMVPLAFVEKGPMRQFDVALNDGTTIPVLGSEEVTRLMSYALVLLLVRSGVNSSPDLKKSMLELVTLQGDGNRKNVETLIEEGKWDDYSLWDPKRIKLDLGLQEFLLNLSTDFVLIGLIPASKSGVRQILKFSYHWVVNLPASGFINSIYSSVFVAFRYSTLEMPLPMHMAYAAKSYHLEFHVPTELDVKKLSLPGATRNDISENGNSVDQSEIPVAHVHGSFVEEPEDEPKVELGVPRYRGIWLTAFLTSLLTVVVLSLAIFLPGAMETLERVSGNAAALMLAAPAVFLSFLILSKEHIFVSWMLNPLRAVVGICAVMLFAMAASLVGELKQPFLSILWWCELFISSIFVLALSIGAFRG